MIPLFVAVIALTGVIISAFISFSITKKTNYLNVITSERSKWLNAVREDISSFISIIGEMHYIVRGYSNEKLSGKMLSEADKYIVLIKLKLNPDGQEEKKILENLHEFLMAGQKNDSAGFGAARAELIINCQHLFKKEWEKIKSEADISFFDSIKSIFIRAKQFPFHRHKD